MDCSICSDVTAYACNGCKRPICRAHSSLYREGAWLREYCLDCSPPISLGRRQLALMAPTPASPSPAAAPSGPAVPSPTSDSPSSTPTIPSNITTEISPRPAVFEWMHTSGHKYRLVLQAHPDGTLRLCTESSKVDSLGADSWRAPEMPRDGQWDASDLAQAMDALQVALARETLGYPRLS